MHNTKPISLLGLLMGVQLLTASFESPGPKRTQDSLPDVYKYTANDVIPSYNTPFLYGINPGYYGNGWSDKMVAEVGHYAGANSIRLSLPGTFIDKYGPNIRKSEFDYYVNDLGMKDLTLFVDEPADAERPVSWYGSCGRPKIFDNLYTEIWDNGENGTPVNDKNYFALYIYELIIHYGDNVRFWEIWNEPDYSYSSGAWKTPGLPGNWWENVPAPCDLKNLQAPVFSYIRMLRIAYEVIKTFKPEDMVCTGGLGYESFLDIVCRYTDNPDNGKVTSAYPLKGGAYFDVLSFHTYPQFKLTLWDNSKGAFVSKRHSDEAVFQYLRTKDAFVNVLKKYGYGSTYPMKHVICTETNIPRKSFDNYIGSTEAQRNFAFKTLVKSQANDIRQVYFYTTSETQDYATATGGFNLMGLYESLKRDTYGNQKLTEEGIAYKTASELLSGYTYNATETAKLAVPAGVEGYAFNDKAGHFRYVMWAATTTDLSETAAKQYTFPNTISFKNQNGYRWNFSIDRSKKFTSTGKTTTLDASPIVFDLTDVVDETNQIPVVFAGGDTAITLPTNTFKVIKASAKDPDGKIDAYNWRQIAGGSITSFSNTNLLGTTIYGLSKPDTYKFVLEATDNFKGVGSDTLVLVVNPEPYRNKLPVARAGADITFSLPKSATNVSGATSSDADGQITQYYWYQINGTGAKFNNPWQVAPQIYNLTKAGTYSFVLRVMDNDRGIGTDTMKVIVNGSGGGSSNTSPIANPGSTVTVNSLYGTATLNGSASYDPDGKINAYLWKFVSGPGGMRIYDNWKSVATVKNFSKTGTYTFSLTVTDDKGATNSKNVNVVVKSNSRSSEVATSNLSDSVIIVGDSGEEAMEIKSTDQLSASVFPNPATTTANLTLDGSFAGKLTLILFNNSGQAVKQEYFEKQPGRCTKSLNLSTRTPGIYYLRIQSENTSPITIKVQVQ